MRSPATNPLVKLDRLVPIQGIRNSKFDDEAKAVFLDSYARFGRKKMAAMAADVSIWTVNEHVKGDPEFALAVEEAREYYKDRVRQAVYEAGVEGIEKPIFGGRFKDEIVGHERVIYPLLTALEAKRVDSEYREKQQVDVNHKGGVLLIPSGMTAEEWEAKYAKPQIEEPRLTEATPVSPEKLPAPDAG